MPLRTFFCDRLEVRVYPDRAQAGAAGASIAGDFMRQTIARDGRIAVVLASAVSQDPFLAALRAQHGIDWPRVTGFHLDEYAAMPASHPASFRRFQHERLIDHVPIGAF